MKWLTDRLAELDGVTPGPWRARGQYPWYLRPLTSISTVQDTEPNAAHIAAYDPDTVRWLLERLAEAKLIIAHASGLYASGLYSEWLQARDWLDKIEQGPE